MNEIGAKGTAVPFSASARQQLSVGGGEQRQQAAQESVKEWEGKKSEPTSS